MSRNRTEQKKARALQEDTGWTYSECLRLVREKTEEEIDQLIEERKKGQEDSK